MEEQVIDIVLPCYNPIQGWVDTILSRTRELEEQMPGYRFRWTVVNDGSSKNVRPSDIQSLESKLPGLTWISYSKNRGKGYALRYGVAQTSSDVVVYTDIDLPYTAKSMAKCIRQVVEKGSDLSIAVRNTSYYERLPAGRRILSQSLRRMNKTVLRLRTADTQGGLKVFSSKARRHFLSTTIDRYLFDLEFVWLCSRDPDVEVTPVESDMRDTIEFSSVPLKVISGEGWNFLKLVVRSRIRGAGG